MKRNRALLVPFTLWAAIFIAVPLLLVVWYGVTVEEPIPYETIETENGIQYRLEDGTVQAEEPW